MAHQVTLEQVERLAAQLPRLEQLSVAPLAVSTVMDEEAARREREQEANELLVLCDATAEMWEGEFNAVEEIQQMRRDRDEQV